MKKNPLMIVLGISGLFFVIFLIVAVIMVSSMIGGGGKTQKKLFAGSGNVGVLEIKGVIMDSKKLTEQAESFEEDPMTKAVIVRINSPGGAVAPSQEIYDAIRRLAKKKPVYASMGSLAASGGYYVACGAKKIYANPGTITGSIGVIMQFADLSKLYQWAKVNPYNIKTGRFKDIGSPNREMSPEEKALLQDMMDNVLMQFRKAVALGRNIPIEKVIELSDGRIFSGEQAKAVKLVDETGGFSDVVEAIAKEAGIKGKPTLIYTEKKKRLFEYLAGGFDDDDDSESSKSNNALIGLLQALLGGGRGLNSPMQQILPKLSGPLYLAPYAVE